MEHREFTPVEFNTSTLDNLRLSKVSMNVEPGRHNSLEPCQFIYAILNKKPRHLSEPGFLKLYAYSD